MIRRFSIDFALLSIALDAGAILAALILAANVRSTLHALPFVRELSGMLVFPLFVFFVFPIVWVLCLGVFSMYNPSRNLRTEQEFSSLTLGSMLAIVALAGILYFFFREFSRALFASFAVFGIILLVLWRIVFRLFSKGSTSPARTAQRALIIGAGMVGRELQQKIEAQHRRQFHLVGFLDDDPEKLQGDPLILADLDAVRSVVQEHRVDSVILALPQRSHVRINQMVTRLHDLPVRVYIIPDYFALTLHHAAVQDFAGIPVLDLRAPALSDYQRLIKRAFDLSVTLLLMPFVAPLMGLLALAVRLDSPGPVLFHQDRVGENGRLFKMHKFRTMVENAEQLRHLVERVDSQGRLIHKAADDPRVTPFGAFLRKFSLDEWPQLFNILKGQMSLVGPRPEMPYLVEQYEPWQRKRFAVPPGLTGWWQVHGRSDKPMHLHTEEDLYYIQNYSPWLDIQILLMTVGAVLSRRGAY